MRAAMAYFAGAGTVIAAIGIGLGGGLTIANVMSPHEGKLEQTKLEQRMSAKSAPTSAEADQPKAQAASVATEKPQAELGKGPVPSLATTTAATTTNGPAAQGKPQTETAAPAPQSSPQPAEAKLAKEQPAKPAEPQTPKPQAAPHDQAAAASDDSNVKARSPEDANATARDTDLKRLAAEKRKAERRQKWADRKKAQQQQQQQQQEQQQRDADARNVDPNARRDSDRPMFRGNDGPRVVRRDTDGPRVVVQQDDDNFDRPRRRGPDRPFGFPGFNLFGGDNDD